MSDEKLTVLVILLNNDGDREEIYSSGWSVDEAVMLAEEAVAEATGDDTYVMTDWSAA